MGELAGEICREDNSDLQILLLPAHTPMDHSFIGSFANTLTSLISFPLAIPTLQNPTPSKFNHLRFLPLSPGCQAFLWKKKTYPSTSMGAPAEKWSLNSSAPWAADSLFTGSHSPSLAILPPVSNASPSPPTPTSWFASTLQARDLNVFFTERMSSHPLSLAPSQTTYFHIQPALWPENLVSISYFHLLNLSLIPQWTVQSDFHSQPSAEIPLLWSPMGLCI